MLTLNHAVLRGFRVSDLPMVVATRNDLAMAAASQSVEPRPIAESVFRTRIEAGHPAVSSGGDGDLEFVVTRHDDPDDVPLGIAGLYAIDRFNGIAELGVTVSSPAARGLGLGFDAHIALVVYAFRSLGLRRLYGNVKADNAAAQRVCTRLGMRREGVLRAHRWKDGALVDLHIYGLLADEWDPAVIDWRAGTGVAA